jgi:hypothetical protein
MRLAGLIANRVVLAPRLSAPITADRLPSLPGDASGAMARALVELPERVELLARQHAIAISTLARAAGGVPTSVLPDVPGGVRVIGALAALAPYLPDG